MCKVRYCGPGNSRPGPRFKDETTQTDLSVPVAFNCASSRTVQKKMVAQPSRAALPVTMESLPHELIMEHILSKLPTVARARMACTTFWLQVLCSDASVWADIELSPPAVSMVLQRRSCAIGEKTHSIAIRSPEACTNRHRFCRWHLCRPPSLHPFQSICGGLTDEGASALIRAAPNLRELHMPGMAHLTSATLTSLLRFCPSLHLVNLRGCEGVTTGFAAEASEIEPQLELRHLDLSHVRVEDTDLVALLALSPSLAHLHLNFCRGLTDESLDALPPTIESFEALGCERLSWRRMEQLRLALGPRGVRCDDTVVLSLGQSKDVAASLLNMLASYRAEEAKRE